MERHAVPQNIMEVEFKLFGALSVKQFAYLAGGLLGALVIYFLPFPIALRFVLIIISVILGLFLSLIKINGQYSSVWLANFVVAMFTSQERVWKKTGYVPDVFHEEVKRTKDETLEKVKKEGRIRASVAPLSKFEGKAEPTQADREEELRLKQIESQLFPTAEGGTLLPVNAQQGGFTKEATADVVTAAVPMVSDISQVSEASKISEAAEKIVIKGYIVAKNAQPIAGALVSVNTEQGEFVKEATTDAKGFFDLGIGLSPGIYLANVAASGYEFDYYKIKLRPGQDILYKFTAR